MKKTNMKNPTTSTTETKTYTWQDILAGSPTSVDDPHSVGAQNPGVIDMVDSFPLNEVGNRGKLIVVYRVWAYVIDGLGCSPPKYPQPHLYPLGTL